MLLNAPTFTYINIPSKSHAIISPLNFYYKIVSFIFLARIRPPKYFHSNAVTSFKITSFPRTLFT